MSEKNTDMQYRVKSSSTDEHGLKADGSRNLDIHSLPAVAGEEMPVDISYKHRKTMPEFMGSVCSQN
jgi:hypothetical protein